MTENASPTPRSSAFIAGVRARQAVNAVVIPLLFGMLIGPDLPLLPWGSGWGWSILLAQIATYLLLVRLREVADGFVSFVGALIVVALTVVAAEHGGWSALAAGMPVTSFAPTLVSPIRAFWTAGLATGMVVAGAIGSIREDFDRAGLFTPVDPVSRGEWIEDLLRLAAAVAVWTLVHRLNQRLVDLNDRAEALEAERAEVLSEERRRIARELHDVVSHHVTVMTVQAQGADAAWRSSPADARVGEALGGIAESGREALTDLRSMVTVLRDEAPGDRQPSPNIACLDELIEATRATGLEVTSDIEPGIRACAATHLAAYRVVQEALTNVRKHGGGGPAVVKVHSDDGLLTAEITNVMLQPPRAGSNPGFGLAGLEERLSVLGGRFEAGPSAEGFTVRATLPCDASSMAT